jgi:serine/threonine-protein kinase CHEK2
LLEDKSTNGTFVNGDKVGKNRVQALKNNDEISLARKENKAYVFSDLNDTHNKMLPPQLTEKYTIAKLIGS